VGYLSEINSRFGENSIFGSYPGNAERIEMNELFAACMPRLKRTAERLTRNREDSEDVLQDALLSGFQNIHQFQRRAKFSSWMHIILCNSVRTMWRKKRCRPIGFSLDPEGRGEEHLHLVDDNEGSNLDPEKEYRRGESSRIVAQLLKDLPPKYREVVWLCKIEELKVTDAAEKLGVPVGTVKARMHRARRMIEKYLNDKKVAQEARLCASRRLQFAHLHSNLSSRANSPGTNRI
jgi:RNA polymerase sigma-70 factor (ECF subfamily)